MTQHQKAKELRNFVIPKSLGAQQSSYAHIFFGHYQWNFAAMMVQSRLACDQVHVNVGVRVFLDKKHYDVYIFVLISLS